MWKFFFLVFITFDGLLTSNAFGTSYSYYGSSYGAAKIKDCYYIGNNTESIGLVCTESTEAYPKNETCYASLIEEQSRIVKLSNKKLIKFEKGCGVRTAHGLVFQAKNSSLSSFVNYDNSYFSSIASFLLLTPELIEIDLSFNSMNYLQESLFSDVPHLTTILLASNDISLISVGVFKPLTALTKLDLSNNSIASIQENLFKYNMNLRVLRLESNPIKRFDSTIFTLFRRVPSMNISYDFVIEIDISHQTKSENKLQIEIGGKYGLEVELVERAQKFVWTKEDMAHLEYFNVSGMHLPNAREVISMLGRPIQTLDVSSNFIGRIDSKIFKNFTNLEHLYASNTNMSNFGFGIINYQRVLKSLDVSYNHLKKVNFTLLFRSVKYLQTLNLEGNDLVEVDTVTKDIFQSLSFLGLSKNNFSCDYLAYFLHQWDSLQVFHNPSDDTHIDGVDCIHSGNNSSEPNKQSSSQSTAEPKDYILMELRILECLIVLLACGYVVITKKIIQRIKNTLRQRFGMERNIVYRREGRGSHHSIFSVDQDTLNFNSNKLDTL